jgi:hypothetical protein
MKGYIHGQSIVLTEALPANLNDGDEVEVMITIVNKSPMIADAIALPAEYYDRASQWDAIPEELAAQLKAEFAEEDRAFAESAVINSLSILK